MEETIFEIFNENVDFFTSKAFLIHRNEIKIIAHMDDKCYHFHICIRSKSLNILTITGPTEQDSNNRQKIAEAIKRTIKEHPKTRLFFLMEEVKIVVETI